MRLHCDFFHLALCRILRVQNHQDKQGSNKSQGREEEAEDGKEEEITKHDTLKVLDNMYLQQNFNAKSACVPL